VADWDEDSARLRSNLTLVLRGVRDSAVRRDVPAVDGARQWHGDMLAGLEVLDAQCVGRFRGEAGLEGFWVQIGVRACVAPWRVGEELQRFQDRLQRAVGALDALYGAGVELDADGVAAVIDLAAFSHAEWVRIHPFVNGNGRTARIWANYLLMRYGLPPVVRLRPRPDGGYGRAGAAAMSGNWELTAVVFRRFLVEELSV
jgi:Fic/DOC family